MNTFPRQAGRQAGYLLLEVLIAAAIFSVGILGAISLQAASIRNNSLAEYRGNASFLANALLGQMWADDRTPATLASNFATDGAKYLTWQTDVNGQLPGAVEHPPTVAVTYVAGTAAPATAKSHVTITVFWQVPGATEVHQYVVIADIK
ncbi:prepilin-type N-terminal cleavage/methylation domain-containing protein [uncultured Thiodictyon sp.]|uniref:type IV pilus modification PilV family protein n=1 Tax=uncultured Thiodictyon sp. TaxID=1846217 RepID=UPI0025D05A05|nr:prepilin-type N-terminal cleavage/methylation domain-containing protein [uncultured Thiodictyon sp.]